MHPDDVTVVIPTKDRYDLLHRTLGCVLRQSSARVRVVVVDDGGGDGTAERLEGRDPRVTVLRNDSSRGVSNARNRGLEQVDTPWVAFLDDDDLWAPDKLARQLAALREQPGTRWACSAAVSFLPDGSLADLARVPEQSDVSRTLLRGNVVPGGGSGVLAATELVRAVGGFDPELANLADWDCWIRLGQESPVATVPTVDVGYRSHPTSMAHAVARSEQELRLLRATHAELYRSSGVEFDEGAWLWYLQGMSYKAGAWRAGARRSLDLVLHHGGRAAAAKQIVKHAHLPTMWRRDDRVMRSRFPEHWAHARSWLPAALAEPPPPWPAPPAGSRPVMGRAGGTTPARSTTGTST